ncbi:putative gustatory receptor 28a [Harmonia axyridis]|uniref:putative gustatory receptor 28a n=1 Tax=Harmonia axyridis TaxID=115357 RepID=UPI001E2772A2|nr:putative gustatory receptor 28a [Harmonia axyridis]
MLDICFEYVQRWIYKNIGNPSDVYSAISPLLFPCFFLGLTPYSIKKSSLKNSINYSKWGIIFTFIMAIVIICSVVFNIENDDTQSFKQNLMYYQEMAAGIFSLCGLLVLCVFSRKLMNIFPNINEVDEAIKVLLIWVDHRETYVKVLLSVIFIVMYMILGISWLILEWTNVVSPFFFRDNRASVVAKLMIPYFLTIIMEFIYCLFMSLVRSRFNLLNKYLETLVPQRKSTKSWAIKVEPSILPQNVRLTEKITKSLDPTFVVNHIAALHVKLTDTAHVINKTFALQQLLKLAVTFVSIVSALYFIAIYFSNPEHRSLDVLFVLWALSNALETLGIVYVTSETSEEANYCPRILHKIRNNSENEELQDTIEIYSLQMYHNRLIFSIMGLFPLDYSLLYTMAAGITTYLVILIQFNPKDFSPIANATTTVINS